MLMTLFYVLCGIAVIFAALYYLRGPLLGMVVTFAVQLGLRKAFRVFKLGSFNIIPFVMLEFSVTTHATRKSPEIHVSWKSFRILMDFSKIFDPLLSLLNVLPTSTDKNSILRNKMIRFVFVGFTASSPGLSFADLLDPPENKMPPPEGMTNENGDPVISGDNNSSGAISYMLIMKRLMQHIVLFVDFEFEDFSFDFQFPSHESRMVGSAKLMTISFPRPPSGSADTVSVLNSIDGGEMEITQSDQRAMYYIGQEGKISVDMHLPTGVMDVLMRVLGREHDQMYVAIAPFMEFYRRYTHAEDNSVEIKMARGLSTGGKMSMRLECEYIDVFVTDHRCPDMLRMTMQQLEGELKTYSLTRANERIYKEMRYIEQSDANSSMNDVRHKLYNFFMRDKDADSIVMSPNKEKVMKAGIKRLDFHTNCVESTAFVEEASMIKTKRVFNENDFVDHDRMNGYAKQIHFEKISPALLDWLVVLQDAANRMPDSRFAHKKNSEMHFLGTSFLFSSQPVSFAYTPPPLDSKQPQQQQQQQQELFDPPLEKLESIPVEDRHWCCFKFTEMEATRELPYNEVDSLIDLKSAQFEMETSLPQHCLAGQYTLSAIGDSDSDGSSSGGDAQSQGSAHSSSAIDEFYEAHECDIAEITMDRHPFSLTDIYGNKDEDDGVDLGAHLLSEGVSTYYPKISLPHIEGNIETSTAKNCSPRSPSPEQLNDQSERQSKTAAHLKSSTGTMWAFPGFTVRMKLGAKMNLEWVKARLMKIDFLNNPTGDVLVSESSAVDSAGRPVVMRDPFLLTSKLCALWCGPSVTCDLGSMQLQGSAAGVLKAQTGFLMLRKTADRITARMTYMKLRGGPPVVAQPSYHIPGTADCSGVHPEPAAQAKTTVRIDDFIIDVPVEISAEDHEKRMHHELDREQRQILRNQQLLEKFRSKRRNSQSSELYDTVDTEMPLVIPLPSPFSSTDRSDKALKFVMTNFEYSSSVGESTAAFETCKVTINSYPEKPWMVMAGLKYRKAVVPLDINDAFYQGLDLQGSVEAAAISDKTVTEVFMESFDMHLSARMEIGIIADSLLAQDAAFKIASAPPKRNALSLRASPASGAYSEDTHEVIYESGSLSPGPERGGVCLGDSPRGYWENTSGATWSSTSRSRERFGSDTTADLEASFAVSRHQLAMEIPPSEEAETTWEQELNAVAQEDAGLLIKPNPTTMHVIFKCYRIIYDAHYNNDYIEDFMTVEQMGFDLTLDSTKMPSAMQDEITGLDLGAEEDQRKGTPSEVKVDKSEGINTACASDSESLLVYTSVFGGQLKFIVKYLKVRLKLLKDPFVEAEDLVFSGPIYNASVMHPNIVKAEVLVALGDSVPYYSFDDLDSGSLEDGAGVAGRTEERGGAKQIERVRFQPSAGLSVALMGSTEPLYVVLVRSSAPAKVYMDMSMSSSTMDICMNASTQECINAINAVMDCVVPPNKDPSPQFVPWDTWRYLLHGSFTCSFAKMSVQYSSHDFMTQKVTLLVSIDALTWYMDKGSFSLTAQNILVEAQISTALLAGRRNQLKKQRQHLEVSKLCSIPAFVLSLTHFRDDIRTKFLSQSEVRDACSVIPTDHSSCTTYSHHDVYLRPAFDSPFPAEDSTGLGLEDYKYLANDKYFHFRSRLMSIRWEIEMRLADREDVPISFNVRLDHLVRVIDAFKTPEEELAQQPDLVDCCLDKASDYFYGVVRPLSPIPIGDMVSVLKLQLILNKIMISSWPSATNLGGIVMTIGSSDLQLRMLRDVSPEFTVLPPSASAGKTTTRSVRRNSLSSYDDDRSVLSELASLPIFPLKIDHFFMDTAFIELYVRSWHLGPASAASVESPLNSRMFSSYRASALGEPSAPIVNEPSTPEEIQSLFVPIYKNAHSTKMVISLTESGVVCTRELLFTQSGMLEKCSERQKKANAKSARTSRRLPSGAGLSVATGDNSGAGGTSTAVAAVFLIGKEWKEHLARAATLAAASQSGSNLQGRRGQQEQHFGGVGRRLSAFSQFMAETKSTARASLEGSSNDHRRNSLRASDLPTARRKTVARRASQVTPVDTKQRGGRLRSDTIDSINTGLSHNPFGVPGVPSNRPGNLRNRRSSIRGGFKAERASIREAAWDPLVDGYRASLLSFSTNHSAFTPPQHALPHSYSLSKAGFVQGRSAQQGNRLASQSEEASSFGSKIWGLRITDLRLLFTIEIRDVLYGYFARGMDLFEPTVVESQSEAQRRRPSNVNAKMEKEGGKATIYDFLQPPTDKEAANARKPPQADEQRNRFGFSPIRAMQATLDASSDAMLHFLSSRQERTGSSPRAAAEAAAAVKELSEKAYTNSAAGGSGGDLSPISKVRFQQRDGSLTQEASGYKSPAKESLDASSSGDEAKPARLSLKTPSASPRASSSPRPAAATPVRTPLGAASAKERSSAAGSSQPEPSKSAKNNSKKPTSQYFFIVELIDPQVNFLDVKTHSSLIIVAGLSSVEGKRFTDATLAPSHDMSGAQQGPNNIRDSMATRGSIAQQALQEPKRQQELRLRMDGVSAFTVPSNSSNDPDDDSDTVHWKQMDSTSGVNVGVGLGVDESGYLGNRRSAIPKESPFMRMAIKDFQIRALYIFWTDVTVKEAKTMYLYPSKEELVCTFKLELPVICVDILSWQFYVIMHVVRNVLLVPPPASATRKSPTQSEAEEAEKNKVLELLRDPVLLAKHELRTNMNIPLDLKHKLSRDELKLLIEENLAGAMMNMELGSARFVEVFVGSCTWILRVNSGSPFSVDSSVNGKESNREWEKEQLKVELTGVHATFSYGEDRSASSLFEVQRFWAKDMDPGRDMLLITKSVSQGSRRKPSIATTNTTSSTGSSHGKDDGKLLDSVVMMPILGQTEHCARCGAAFLLEENHATACTFHANQDGDPGEYKDVVITDELTGVQSLLKAWTCCGRHHAFAAGCSARPHTCKEVMIQVRAEANPTTRVENIDLSILKSVDISIFPNSTYDLQVHITKSLADVLHKYFSIDDMENYEITANYTDTTAEIEEKHKSNWKRVKNVGKLLRRKNKTSSGEGDEGMFSDDEYSLGPSSPMAAPTGAENSPFGSPPASPSPAPPSTPKESRTLLSPWFRSSTPKRSATPSASGTSAGGGSVGGASVSTEDSATGRSESRGKKAGFSFGGFFSRRTKPVDADQDAASADQRRAVSADMATSEMNSSGHMTFNMMRKRTNSAAPVKQPERRSSTGSTAGATDPPHASDHKSSTTVSTSRRQEGVYVKFLRLGGIQIEVSTAGFMLNLNKFKAQMDEFRCQGEVLQWNTLVANMERHMAVSLFTNAASNSLSRFTQMFRFSGGGTGHAIDTTPGPVGSSSDVSSAQVKKAAFVKWERVGDPNTATSLKRSALGLPPSQLKSANDQRTGGATEANDGTTNAESALAGKFLLGANRSGKF